jgi:hypothetical protein
METSTTTYQENFKPLLYLALEDEKSLAVLGALV